MEKRIEPFIKTQDEDTKNELIKEGFQLISESGGVWTFLNEPPAKTEKFSKNANLIFSRSLEF